jgi:hypothetical protein
MLANEQPTDSTVTGLVPIFALWQISDGLLASPVQAVLVKVVHFELHSEIHYTFIDIASYFAVDSTISLSMILGNLATLAPFLFLWSLPLVLALDPNVPTVCYSLDGKSKRVSGYRCDNSTTGHSTCCDPGAICYSNGVCQQSNGPVQVWCGVRM